MEETEERTSESNVRSTVQILRPVGVGGLSLLDSESQVVGLSLTWDGCWRAHSNLRLRRGTPNSTTIGVVGSGTRSPETIRCGS